MLPHAMNPEYPVDWLTAAHTIAALVGWLVGVTRDEAAHDVGGSSIRLLEEVGVDVEGCRSVTVAEPACHGANVNTCAEQLRRDEVA